MLDQPRLEPHGYDGLDMCSYLVDTWCLGVKNAMGPKRLTRSKLETLRRECYAPWQSRGIPIPLDLAQARRVRATARLRGTPQHRGVCLAPRVVPGRRRRVGVADPLRSFPVPAGLGVPESWAACRVLGALQLFVIGVARQDFDPRLPGQEGLGLGR